MKRKQSSYVDRPRQRFAPIALYRDDLEQIITTLEKRGLQVKLSDNHYEYESLDEITEAQGNIVRSLAISGSRDSSDSSVDFEFEKDGIRLRSHKEDDLVACWQEIKAMLDKLIPPYARFLKLENWAWSFFVLAVFGQESIKAIASDPVPGFLFIVALVISGYGSIYSIVYRSQNSLIYLKRKHEVLSFFQKNGEKILMLIVGAIVGLIVKAISDALFGN